MNKLEFSLHFAEHIDLGLIYGLVYLLVYIILFRKYIYSIFDPLLFFTILSAFGGSTVLYLYHFDLISPFYFWSYITTQIAFVAGFRLVNPPPPVFPSKKIELAKYSGTIQILYPLAVLSFVVAQLYVYAIAGVPILLESRLEVFSSGGGFGALSRIIFVTSNLSLATATYRLIFLQKSLLRFIDYAVVIFSIGVAILSGSKGALLGVVFTMSLTLFYCRLFYGGIDAELKLRSYFIFIIILAVPVALMTINLQSGIDNLLELLSVVGMRFFNTGDIFYMLYPMDVIDHLPRENGFVALFYSPLGSLRIIPRELLPINLGLQAFWYHYDTTLLSGPNARHNVFGLFYFGPIFSILFSLILGFLYSLARNICYRRLPRTVIGMNVYVLIGSCAIFIEQDIAGQAIEYFFSVLLIFPFLYVSSLLFFNYVKQQTSA